MSVEDGFGVFKKWEINLIFFLLPLNGQSPSMGKSLTDIHGQKFGKLRFIGFCIGLCGIERIGKRFLWFWMFHVTNECAKRDYCVKIHISSKKVEIFIFISIQLTVMDTSYFSSHVRIFLRKRKTVCVAFSLPKSRT